MEIPKESLDELKEILKGKYGREMTDKEIFEIGNGLLRFFKLLQSGYREDKGKEIRKSDYSE